MRAAFPSVLIHRLSLEFPIQSNPSPYTKRITHHNVRSKKRARKGGARGGKTGFATLSAFPLVPAHAKMVPLKGKVPAFQASSRKWKTSSGRRSGFGFIVDLRDRSYRRISIHRRFIKLSGNIPIENCHTGFYIRHQPDQCQIQCKYGKNDPRNKT